MVAAWPWGAYLGEDGLNKGIASNLKLHAPPRQHHHAQAKAVSNYTNSILANMEAVEDGYDEALLLDASGFVSEGPGENIFMIRRGVVYTRICQLGRLTASPATPSFRSAKTRLKGG